MRKLTGYIGALIVVFALMGSILAGYALNVNGESTVINEYEKVTDVSGLYTHSQEPTYIEYNPASNYIGYEQETKTYNSDAGVMTYKDLQYGELAIIKTTGEITINGLSEGVAPIGAVYYFTNQFYIERKSDGNIGISSVVGGITATSDVTITTSGSDTTVSTTGFNVTFRSIWHNICYWNIDDTYNYYRIDGRLTGNNTDYNAYFRTSNDILTLSYIAPSLYSSDPSTFSLLITQGGGYGILGNNAEFGIMASQWIANTRTPVSTGGYEINPNYQPVTDYWTDVNTPGNKTMTGLWIFYPRSISNGGGIGINYTESNRVNNYLMETTDTTVSFTSGDINLNTLGAPDQFYYNSYGTKQIINGYYLFASNRSVTGETDINSYPRYSISVPASQPAHDSIYDSNNPNWYYDGWHNVKLSNVLLSFNAPVNTKSIKITTDSIYGQYFSLPNVTIDKNLVWFSYLPNLLKDYGSVPSLNSEMGKKDYLIFDVANNLATVYTYDGTARYSGSPDDIGIFYYTNGTTYKGLQSWRNSNSSYTSYIFYDMNDRPAPTIKLTATIATPGVLKYADITKGYAIKSGNVGNTIWTNNYQNGVINLLFRADDVNQTYHNELTISGNNITVDFENNRFYVTLGTNERVDIGTWRNIILNVDLTNGYLSAVPVRTFNSFTNVIMDNTSIMIGELTSTGSINSIEWAPTSNSLLFNVYSTSVFMDTYGVVMVNPTIDITNYFTDLNNFYRMRLFNFSVLGDSITVNGITADVVNNTITIDGQTVQLKEMAITYADGRAYISDSNASIDLGEIADNTISMAGAWYFETELQRGYTSQKMIYNWDWGDFILNNTQFCIMFMGLAVVALIVARRYCTMAITDYIVLVLSFIIALTVQVVA